MPRPSRPETGDPRDIAVWVDSRFDDLREEIIAHIDKRHQEHMAALLEAFPKGDLHRHRLWHEDRTETEGEHRDLRRNVTKWASLGVIGTLASFNWDAIKEAFKQWMR